MSLRICIAGPIATADVVPYLEGRGTGLPAGYGGAPLTAVLIGELLALGHEVIGITVDYRMAHDALPASARGRGFTFVVLPGRLRAWRFNGLHPGRALDLFRIERRRVAAAIQSATPDVVHAHWTYEFALGAIDSGVPHVVTCHDSPAAVLKYTRSPYRAMRYLMAREALAKARCLSAVSGYMAAEVGTMARVPVEVVPNPLAPYVLERGSVRPRPAAQRMAMVCNGWDRIKNPEPALRAFAKFRAAHPQAELHLFGADFGPGERAERWARSKAINPGMVFHGLVPHRELIAALDELDLLLHPSLEESFGVVLAEAMALGLPVVAGAVSGAVPWVVGADANGHSHCAVLTDVRDATAIARAIDIAFDADYPTRSESAFARARSLCDPHAVAHVYMRLYSSACRVQASARSQAFAPAAAEQRK